MASLFYTLYQRYEVIHHTPPPTLQGSGFGSAGGNNAASTITSTAKSAADNVADNLSGFDGGSSIPKVEDKKPATARLQKFDKLGTSDSE
jgi:hypothetical protein